MSTLLLDLKHAIRSLRNNRAFVAVAVLTLALGIGANTATFSVVRGVLLRPLPYENPQELVRVWEVNPEGGAMQAAWRNYEDLRHSSGFTALAAYNTSMPSLIGREGALRLWAAPVSLEFFEVMRPRQIMGRLTRADDHRAGAAPVVVVSERFWRTHMDATTDLASRPFQLAGKAVEVIGVVSAEFDFPAETDLWYPIELTAPNSSRTSHNYAMVGRLADGMSPDRAKADLDRIIRGIIAENPGVLESESAPYFPASSRVQPLREAMVGDSRRPLWIVLGAATLLLLVACTNLASTSLARGTMREKEIAVRLSLGGQRRQIARLFFIESLLLSVLGGVVGLAFAAAAIKVLPALAAEAVPRLGEVRLDGAVLAFTFVMCVVTAILFGLLPALRGSDFELGSMLRSGGRGSSRGGREWVWSGLVVSEIALALLLLVGAGLLIRSFATLLSTDPGHRTENLLLATVVPPWNYAEPDAKGRFHAAVLDRVRAVPGVAEVGLAARGPFTGLANGLVDIEGGPQPSASGSYQVVTSEYFRVMEIPLLRGRLFEPTDRAESEHVVVVNESFAKLAWPGEDPIGKRMTAGGMDNFWQQEKWARVIGIVRDIRQTSLDRKAPATYYFSLAQRPARTWSATLAVRARTGEPAALTAALREAILQVDRNALLSFTTIEERMSESVTDRRFTMVLLGGFAGIGLLLALIGIYGVVSYSVVRRQREIGIRLALGARPGQVRSQVIGRVLGLAGIGVVVGTLGALAATRLLASLLYEVSPLDVPTFVAVALVLGATASLAGWVPALRSSRVDPLITMQQE